jgi:Peptidase family M28
MHEPKPRGQGSRPQSPVSGRAGNQRPTRPQRVHTSQSLSLSPVSVLLGLAIVAVFAAMVILALLPDDEDPAAGSIPNPTVDLGINQTPVNPGTTAAPSVETPVAPTAAAATLACTDVCLIRLAGEQLATETQHTADLQPAYVGTGHMWAGATADAITNLQARGLAANVIAAHAETLRLYVVRAPAEMAIQERDELVQGFGTVLDEVNGQILVEVERAPAKVLSLTDWGIAVEKVPPMVAAPARDQSKLPKLVDSPNLLKKVSQSEIEQTILDLQGMSSTDGSGHGTRYYTQTGNAMAAEYLATRFAEYGAKVWYEDFIADDGTLGINVVAELPGRDDSAVYLWTAHYDSIADDTAPDQSTAPGALDNGTGLAVMVEMARVLSDYQLEHPVRFVAFDIEEYGLQGSQAFADDQLKVKVLYDAAFNVDSVGAAYGVRQLVINANDDSVWIENLIWETHDAYGFTLGLDIRQNPYIKADDWPMSEAGIPTVGIYSVLYGDPLINQSHDTIDGVDLPYVTDVTALMLLCAAQLAGE